MNQIDSTCPECGALSRIYTDKRRVKISCDNCFVSYWTTKSECVVFPEHPSTKGGEHR